MAPITATQPSPLSRADERQRLLEIGEALGLLGPKGEVLLESLRTHSDPRVRDLVLRAVSGEDLSDGERIEIRIAVLESEKRAGTLTRAGAVELKVLKQGYDQHVAHLSIKEAEGTITPVERVELKTLLGGESQRVAELNMREFRGELTAAEQIEQGLLRAGRSPREALLAVKEFRAKQPYVEVPCPPSDFDSDMLSPRSERGTRLVPNPAPPLTANEVVELRNLRGGAGPAETRLAVKEANGTITAEERVELRRLRELHHSPRGTFQQGFSSQRARSPLDGAF